MSKGLKIGIVSAVVILLMALLYFFGIREKEETYVTDDWSMTYDPDDRGPYGTYMMKELLDTTGMFGNFLHLNDELEKVLEDDPEQNDIYFFIGRENYLSDSSTQYLMDFIYNGNTAFIAARDFPYDMLDQLCYHPEDVFEYNKTFDSTQYFKFEHADLYSKRYKFDFIQNNEKRIKTWRYFDSNAFSVDEEEFYQLGYNTKDKVNFIKIQHGNGQLFLHSTPYAFTNICMMKRDGFQYAENILKHIPPGRVQWDKYNLHWHYENTSDSGGGGEERRSMLEFILSHPPLFWAFFILLGAGILYALFKGKRMQKIIPATESKDNMSLQYINTLSSLYLQEKKHNKLIRLKEKTFLNFIAEHYYIHSNKPDAKFIEKVAVKSHVPEEQITAIFDSFNQLEQYTEVSDDQLIELHQKIENFYKTCR